MTKAPHPDSFLAFACWFYENLEQLEKEFPPWVTPAERDDSWSSYEHAVWLDLKRRASDFSAAFTTLEIRRLLEAGVPEELMGTPGIEKLVATNVCLIKHYLEALSQSGQRRNRSRGSDLSQPWVPQRSTVALIVTGVHLASNAESRTHTAKILNRGLARTAEAYGFTSHDVRNALDSFVRTNLGADDLENATEGMGALAASRALVLNQMWLRLREDPRFARHPRAVLIERLHTSGALLRWHAELTDEVKLGVTDRAAISLIERKIAGLEKLLKKRLEQERGSEAA